MTKLFLSLSLSLTALLAQAAPAAAGPNQDRQFDHASKWDKLGQRRVDGKAEKDRIDVHRTERYSTIRLVVESSGIELHNITIFFANGQSWSPDTRLVFNGGSTSRDIQLPGGLRQILRIELVSSKRSGSPMVEVWGLGAGKT
jgi:hypothetical protein